MHPIRRAAPILAALALALAGGVAQAAAAAWPLGAGEKVFPESQPPGRPAAALWLQAAQDDVEGGLVALRSDAPVQVPATVGDLVGPAGRIPAGAVRRFRAGYVPLREPSTGVDGLESGEYADPLVPLDGPLDVPGGRTVALYLQVHVPAGAAPGRYEGAVDLGPLGSMPVRVDVFGVRAGRDGFPVVARLETLSLAAALGVGQYDPELAAGVRDDLLPMLREHGVAPGKAPLTDPKIDPGTWAADYADRLIVGAGQPKPVGTNLDHMLGMGFGWVEVPFEVRVPTAAGEARDPGFADPRRATLARTLGARFGGPTRAFALPVDEPGPDQYAGVARAGQILHREAAGVAVMVTEAPNADARRVMGGAVDIWAPPVWDYYLYRDQMAAERAGGRGTWWYTYGSDTQRFTMNLLIDKPTTEARVSGWLAAEEDVGGMFYYSLNSWVKGDDDGYQSPWTSPWYLSHVKQEQDCGRGARRVGGNGEASLLYPGTDPRHPAFGSLRLEALRDGIEDHAVLLALRDAYPAYFQRIADGLSRPYSGPNDGFDSCKPTNRLPYLPVVATDPQDVMAARYAALLKLTGGRLARLSGRVMSGARPVAGAWVRFGLFSTTTDAGGNWVLDEVPPVPGRIVISRDPEGLVDPTVLEVSEEEMAGGDVRKPAALRRRPERPVFSTPRELRLFRARVRPAAARVVGGRRLAIRISRRYLANGREPNGGRIVAPEVEAWLPRTRATRAQRDWRGWRYLEFDVAVESAGRAEEPWRMVVTPGNWRSARYLVVGQRRQHMRLDLAGLPLRNVRYLRFGLESALPVSRRGGQRPTARLVIGGMTLTR